MQTLQAIETTYRGHRFRSRLEARWAVWLDALNIDWRYEQQGYDLGTAGQYLPDFWLPEFQCFVEVKPEPADETSRDCRVAAALARISGHRVWMVFDPQLRSLDWRSCGMVPAYRWDGATGQFSRSYVFQIPSVTLPQTELPSGLTEEQELDFFAKAIAQRRKVSDVLRARHNFDIDGQWLVRAFRAFRSARFEHGQSGAT